MTKRSELKDVGRCPITSTDYTVGRKAFETYELLDAEREAHRFSWSTALDHGYYMVQRYDDVVDIMQRYEEFNSDQPTAYTDNLAVKFMPQGINPPHHTDVRRLLNPYFSPAAVKRVEGIARQRIADMITEFAGSGATDVASGFAILFPTEVFLEIFGLPLEDGEKLLPWIEAIFGGVLSAGDGAEGMTAEEATEQLNDYLRQAIRQRRENPGDPTTDLITRLIQGQVLGAPVPEDDLVTICMSTLAAGLDTTRSALSYMLYHLATHPETRQECLDDPSLWPKFVEEAIRLYPLVLQVGRQVTEDMEYEGLDLRKGDMIWLGVAQACRDPRKFEAPDQFDMHRENLNNHIAFGAGQHRCLGMHLARRELVIALEEWHRQIPHYRIAPDADLRERGGQLRLEALPLEWDTRA